MIAALPAPANAPPSFVLHERARRYDWAGSGSLSIKSFYGGRALYRVDGGMCALDDTHYLLLNHDQPYAISIESEQPVESLCVFFAPGLAEDVRHSLTATSEHLLESPDASSPRTVCVFDRTYPHDAVLSPGLAALRRALPHRAGEPGWLEEQLHDLAARLLQAQALVRREVAALPAARAATRAELYRRVHRARDYADACFDQPLTLDDLARVAQLSSNHLLRTFKQAFRQTPHQYLTGRRLQRAEHLLCTTELSVTDVCLAVGFQSLGSFSWLFRRRYGQSPERYRRRKR